MMDVQTRQKTVLIKKTHNMFSSTSSSIFCQNRRLYLPLGCCCALLQRLAGLDFTFIFTCAVLLVMTRQRFTWACRGAKYEAASFAQISKCFSDLSKGLGMVISSRRTSAKCWRGFDFLQRYSLMRLLFCLFVCLLSSREKVDRKFIDACMYVKDRMEEVSSPDKEMVRIVLFLSFSKRGETRMLMLLSGLSVYLYIHVDMHTHAQTLQFCAMGVFSGAACCNVDLFANEVALGSLLTFSLEPFGSIVLNNLVSSAISQA